MKLITMVAIKRCIRLHPDWTPEQITEHVTVLIDASGPYSDSITLQDVKDAMYSMRPPGRLL